MSFQQEWVLPRPVEAYSNEALIGQVRRWLPTDAIVEVTGVPSDRTLSVRFATTDVESIADGLEQYLFEDWQRDLDPPRHSDGSYLLHIEVVDDERPILRIYSNEGDNRQGWPILAAIASGLAEALGGVPEDEAPEPSDKIPMFIAPGKASKPN
jgi:hypothetical protein